MKLWSNWLILVLYQSFMEWLCRMSLRIRGKLRWSSLTAVLCQVNGDSGSRGQVVTGLFITYLCTFPAVCCRATPHCRRTLFFFLSHPPPILCLSQLRFFIKAFSDFTNMLIKCIPPAFHLPPQVFSYPLSVFPFLPSNAPRSPLG